MLMSLGGRCCCSRCGMVWAPVARLRCIEYITHLAMLNSLCNTAPNAERAGKGTFGRRRILCVKHFDVLIRGGGASLMADVNKQYNLQSERHVPLTRSNLISCPLSETEREAKVMDLCDCAFPKLQAPGSSSSSEATRI